MAGEIVPAGDAAAVDERDVSEVTRPDPLETEPVKLVSGEVQVAKAVPMTDASGAPLSDLHCPLIVDEADIVKTAVYETHRDENGDTIGRTMHRTPLQVVNDPVDCPDCGKIVERHMLVLNPITGLRRCAIATNFEARKLDVAEILGKTPGGAVAAVDEASPAPVLPETAPDVDEKRESGLSFEPATAAPTVDK